MINILLNSYTFDSDYCYDSLKNIISAEMRVLVFPFGFRSKQIANAKEWERLYNRENGLFSIGLAKVFSCYGVPINQIEWINYFSASRENLVKKIRSSDILYFCGGLPDIMYSRLSEFDILDELKDFDGIVMGDSAGAVIQLDEYHISPDPDYQTFHYQNGLGYIRGFDIEVHYTGTPIQNESIDTVLLEKKIPVFAIAPNGVLVVDSNNYKSNVKQGTKVTSIGNVHVFSPTTDDV